MGEAQAVDYATKPAGSRSPSVAWFSSPQGQGGVVKMWSESRRNAPVHAGGFCCASSRRRALEIPSPGLVGEG